MFVEYHWIASGMLHPNVRVFHEYNPMPHGELIIFNIKYTFTRTIHTGKLLTTLTSRDLDHDDNGIITELKVMLLKSFELRGNEHNMTHCNLY